MLLDRVDGVEEWWLLEEDAFEDLVDGEVECVDLVLDDVAE